MTCRNDCWIGDHLRSHDMQTAATRAFRAVEQYAYGKRGWPRFKKIGRHRSIEGKGNAVIIRRTTPDGAEVVRYGGLTIKMIIRNIDGLSYEARALANETKFVRLVCKAINGRTRWYAQLIQRGQPPQRRLTGTGRVGLDLGPSEIAAVSNDDALLTRFCPHVFYLDKQIRVIRRQMDRSRRASNPHCFDMQGPWIKGMKITHRSKTYLRLRAQLAEMERKLGSARDTAHGDLANRVLGQGNTIHTEKLAYRSFQKNYGKSVRRAAPGMFISKLKRKAERAGGEVVEISTGSTRLSQACHISGDHVKKPLSQRYHMFPDGSRVQRDLYSAYLARHVAKDAKGVDRLDFSSSRRGWNRAEPLLMRAEVGRRQSASGCGMPLPHIVTIGGVGVDRTQLS